MIFTLCYVYATVMQWWRLRSLATKLNGTLNEQNALLVSSGASMHDSRKHRSLENLLFCTENRIACTVVPKQKLNLSQWIAFPKNLRYFPIYIDDNTTPVSEKGIFILLQAVLDNYTKHQSEIVQMESFGELIGWKASDCFEVVVKTDMDHLTKLINQFSHSDVDINHELQLLKVETVDVEGTPTVIKYEKKYLKEQTLKYSYAPVHWKKFVTELKDLYSKMRDITNPKIKIENGSPKFPDTSKPMKKESRKEDKKNTLDVASTEHRRHKKTRDTGAKTKHKTKAEEVPVKPPKKRTVNKLVKQSSVKENEIEPKIETWSKPPNVLVYSDSIITKDNVKRILFSILNKEKYTIYDLPMKQNTWDKSTVLVVVCGNVPPDLTSTLIQYLLSGGKLLCLCSDLMYSVLHSFTTAEVREHELVRFSYGSWQRVKMMHHIFCYQASPAKKQFSKDSESNHSSNGSSPLAPRTPTNVELRHNDKDYNIQVQVLGTEETWQTPSLMLAKVKSSHGRAVFSQVHLEIDPDEFENDEEKYRSLLSSNEARLEILKDILEQHLELCCDESFGKVEYTPGYFLGRYDAKMNMVLDCESITNNQLTGEKLNVVFCGHNVDPGQASNIRLPVLIHSCPSNFSTLEYFETLETESVGRLVIYADILTSSQHVMCKKLRHGLVVIPRQQTNGMGRSKNSWISPMGSAAFSLQMHIPLDSNMGRSLPLIQHLVMVAVISAVRKYGADQLPIGIKWPNDLYVDTSVKVGGIMVTSTIYSNQAIVNIGCGVNLSNQNPTVCINDLIERSNRENGTSIPPLPYEKYFALVFNEIEKLYDDIQGKNLDGFLDFYYRYWLHSNAEVTIRSDTDEPKRAKVVGIDQYGYLTVRLDDGTMTSVQPDGNSFDLMSGLIAPKKF